MSTERIRVGIVGCGRTGAHTRPELRDRLGRNWVPLSHADGVKAISEFALVACCDTDGDAATAAAERYGAKFVYTDYAKMLKEAELDLLCVATRGDVRPEILCAAAEARVRAVHCEKPLAHSVGLAAKAARALDNAKVAFSYGTLRTYMPIFRQARTIACDGTVGALQSVMVKFGRTGLLWNHPHSMGVLCMLSGVQTVEFVQGNMHFDDTRQAPHLIDADPLILSATIGFTNGVTGHIVDQDGLSVEVAGSKAMLSVVGDGSWLVQGDYAAGLESDPQRKWRFVRDGSDTSGRVNALLELRNALKDDRQTTLTATDAWAQHRLLFAVAQSHIEGGRRVRVEDVDPDLRITGLTNGRVA
jgi:predicted dehydrogenase